MGPTSSLRNIQKLFKHLLLLLRKKEIDQWKFIGSYSGSQMWKTLVIRSLVKYFTHYLIFTHTVMQFGIVIIDISDMYVNLFELNLLFIIVEIIDPKGRNQSRCQARIIRLNERRSVLFDLKICVCQWNGVRVVGSIYCYDKFNIYLRPFKR